MIFDKYFDLIDSLKFCLTFQEKNSSKNTNKDNKTTAFQTTLH